MIARSLLDGFTEKLEFETVWQLKLYDGEVYHYSSLGNVNPILLGEEGLCLWASRIDCLNDASEGTLPVIRFAQACDELKAAGRIDESFYELIRDVRPNRTGLILYTASGKTRPVRDEFKTYVTSFSEDPDALAMWNYYSKGNRYEGMNIGVSSRDLLNSLSSRQNQDGTMMALMVKVIYDEREQLELIERALLDLYENYEQGYGGQVRYHIGTLLSNLKPVFKYACFSHEKEVRLFVNVYNKLESGVRVEYRTCAGYVVPYVSLNFDRAVVSRITLGPSLGSDDQKAVQKKVVEEMLKSCGYRAAVEQSNIPVRY